MAITAEKAEILALEALGWLAGDEDGIGRFLKASGMEGADLRDIAGAPETAVAILDFLLQNEDLLVRFCEENATAPQILHRARHALGGQTGD